MAHDIKDMLASLCDAMKRVERAVASEIEEERDYQLSEAKKRRERVERQLLRGER